MLSIDWLRLQCEQHAHDMRNHADVACLHKTERLKHYGLHYCKYVGRLARGQQEDKPIDRTIVDSLLVCLSAANTLHQKLAAAPEAAALPREYSQINTYADAAGRFADACEKIDHLEDFRDIAIAANLDIAHWLSIFANENAIDLPTLIVARRSELAQRHFFIGV